MKSSLKTKKLYCGDAFMTNFFEKHNYLFSKNKNCITFLTMRKFEDQLSRMKSLMTYRMVTESENKKGSFEYHRLASDGKAYGIFKECTKYYIKTAPGDKETIAEAYDYIGGWNNRKDYEYDSFANAQKQFDLKMMSINEACGVKANAVTLDPSKKEEFIIEGTDEMKRELARQRQLMKNVNTIINEGSYIGVGDPERVSGSNDADKPFTEKGEAKLDKDMPKSSGKPESESEPYGDGKAPEKGKDVKSSDVLSKGEAVAAQHPSGGKVTRVDEGCEGGECSCAPNGAKDWGTEGIGKGNGDPKSNGWEMEGQEYVNEEVNDAKDWDAGLPSGAGTGEANTDHNNDPFKETVNESEEDEYEVEDGDDVESADDEGLDVDGELGNEEPIDVSSDELGGEEDELGGEEEISLDDEALDDEAEADEDDLSGDLESEIAELRAEVEALKAQIEGEESTEEVPADDEVVSDDDVEIDLSSDDDVDELDEGLGFDALKGAFKSGREVVRSKEDLPTAAGWDRYVKTGTFDPESTAEPTPEEYSKRGDAYDREKGTDYGSDYAIDAVSAQPGLFGRLNRRALKGAAQVGMGVEKAKQGIENFKYNTLGFRNKAAQASQPAENELEESKQAYLNSIVESVVKSINEEKTVLHDFGKHPGYRKKPMDLPPTGSDQENGMRDWNDDSVHSEEPFGSKIGDGKPYEKLVQVLTDRVMESLKKKV